MPETLATCTYVFGLESSGTRFIAKNIAKRLDADTKWDGDHPPCWQWRGHTVQHISLPHGKLCTPQHAGKGIDIVPVADVCPPPSPPAPKLVMNIIERAAYLKSLPQPLQSEDRERWIANISGTMRARPWCQAIIVTRSPIFQRLSKLSAHGCGAGSKEWSPQHAQWTVNGQPWSDATEYLKHVAWRREDANSRRSVREAVESLPAEQLLVVPYEELEWLGSYHWQRIARHLTRHAMIIPHPEAEEARTAETAEDAAPWLDISSWQPPAYASGDRRWAAREHLADMMRVAAIPASDAWNESAWQDRLARHFPRGLGTPAAKASPPTSPPPTDALPAVLSPPGAAAAPDEEPPLDMRFLETQSTETSAEAWARRSRVIFSWLTADIEASQPDGTAASLTLPGSPLWWEACVSEGSSCDEWLHAHAEASAWTEQMASARYNRQSVQLALAMLLSIVLTAACAVPCPPVARVRRRLHEASRTLHVGAVEGEEQRGHLGVTLGPRMLAGVPCVEVCWLCERDLMYLAGARVGDVLVSVESTPVVRHGQALVLLQAGLDDCGQGRRSDAPPPSPRGGGGGGGGVARALASYVSWPARRGTAAALPTSVMSQNDVMSADAAVGKGGRRRPAGTFEIAVVAAASTRATERDSLALYAPLWMRTWRCLLESCRESFGFLGSVECPERDRALPSWPWTSAVLGREPWHERRQKGA